MSKNILILHGPNLNLLGTRETKIYGNNTLINIDKQLKSIAIELKVDLIIFQTNHEGELIDRIHRTLYEQTDFIIINAGAYTHTSVALRDALSCVNLPFIEVHLSNPYKREKFRQKSYLIDISVGSICGLGLHGYEAALRYAAK